jgi:hypothetical protein
MKAESRGGREKFDVAALAAKFFSCGLNDKIKPQQLGDEFFSTVRNLIIDTGYL